MSFSLLRKVKKKEKAKKKEKSRKKNSGARSIRETLLLLYSFDEI